MNPYDTHVVLFITHQPGGGGDLERFDIWLSYIGSIGEGIYWGYDNTTDDNGTPWEWEPVPLKVPA